MIMLFPYISNDVVTGLTLDIDIYNFKCFTAHKVITITTYVATKIN